MNGQCFIRSFKQRIWRSVYLHYTHSVMKIYEKLRRSGGIVFKADMDNLRDCPPPAFLNTKYKDNPFKKEIDYVEIYWIFWNVYKRGK